MEIILPSRFSSRPGVTGPDAPLQIAPPPDAAIASRDATIVLAVY